MICFRSGSSSLLCCFFFSCLTSLLHSIAFCNYTFLFYRFSYLKQFHVIHNQQLEDSFVTHVSFFNLEDFVLIDSNVLQSLQIFNSESHPSVIKGRGREKEGFSIFGLMDRTKCAMGRKMLRQWFLKPSRNIDLISERHSEFSLTLSLYIYMYIYI